MNTQVIAVVKVTKANGVLCVVDGKEQWVPVATIKAAAKQDDRDLAATYQTVWAEVQRLASLEKHVTIRVEDHCSNGLGFEARMYDVAGEFISGRTVAADFGCQGNRSLAMHDAERAKDILTKRGYAVEIIA